MRRSATVEALERACAEDPGRAACWSRAAEAREALGMDAAEAWRRAVDRNPRDAQTLTQAAVAAESRGNTAHAERLLLQAEKYNHLWLPRWTLANFYFRQNRKTEFWKWMSSALDRSYGDPTAAFRLCSAAGGHASFLLDHVLPASPEILNAFVQFLIREKSYPDLEYAAAQYAKLAGASEQSQATAALTAAADALVTAGRVNGALRIWNDLANRRYIPYPSWSAASPLVNGTFQTPLPSPAFDWRPSREEGIQTIFGAPMDGVKISLSGAQAVDAELLSQYLALPPSRRFRLAFEYQTPQIGPDESGLYWRAGGVIGDELPSAGDWETGWVKFETAEAPNVTLYKLALIAGRKPGKARMQGEVWVRRVRLESY